MNKKVIFDWIIAFIVAVIIFVILSWFFQIGKISGSSMEITYQDGKRVLVQRQLYNIQKGDVITFWTDKDNIPDEPSGFFGKIYENFNEILYLQPEFRYKELHIKRVVGMPGDHVVVQNEITEQGKITRVYVNDELVSLGTNGNTSTVDADITLEDDEYFVLGDNTNNSRDSRDHGPVKSDDIFGKIINARENQNPLKDEGSLMEN